VKEADAADVLVIAGTSDANAIIQELASHGIHVMATVATAFGHSLVPTLENVVATKGRLDRNGLHRLMAKSGVKCVLDASHPYAREVSANAIGACADAGIAYLRYERPSTVAENEDVIHVRDIADAAAKLREMKGTVFISTGSTGLEVFARVLSDFSQRAVVRVLPDDTVIARCKSLGLPASSIIASRGPFSEESNMAIFRATGATILVLKDSGSEGGTPQKLSAARRLGLAVILVDRPVVEYPWVTGSIQEAVSHVVRNIKGDTR
jgi:precorrin-6A/cobalt-precorrin-6A reductase